MNVDGFASAVFGTTVDRIARMKASTTFTLVLLAACGANPTPGSNPHDMAAAQHEAEARAHENEAGQHQAQYDPNQMQSKTKCNNAAARAGTVDPCWTSEVNPTASHLAEAEAHRKMAADHRAASNALRTAETSSCAGIPDGDRDNSPLVSHATDIESVEPLFAETGSSKDKTNRPTGARVTIRAVPGLTPQYLQRLVECHVARNASMGFAMPEMASCPLSVKGASGVVESTGGAFRIDIKSTDVESANEIARRAQSLKK